MNEEQFKNYKASSQRNGSTILHSALINKATGIAEEVTMIDIKTKKETIIYRHPKIKKWREGLKKDKKAKIDHTILDKSII